jgi:hypothetical protein
MPATSSDFKRAAALLASKLRESPCSLRAFRRRITSAQPPAEAGVQASERSRQEARRNQDVDPRVGANGNQPAQGAAS